MIKRTIEAEFFPTPDEIGEILLRLPSDDFCHAFNYMAKNLNYCFPMQMQYVADENLLTDEAKHIIRTMAQYMD